MHTQERGELRCQMFIAQRDGGTVWESYKTLIGYAACSQLIIRSNGECLYTGQQFPTLGAAVEAAKRRAWDTIQKTFPGVRKWEVVWDLVTERVEGFVSI
jgi:hypothetical protein